MMCQIKWNSIGIVFLILISKCCEFTNAFSSSESFLVKAKRYHHDRTRLFDVKPIDGSGWPHKFPAKDHCSKCGLCETSFVSHVTDACAFLNEGMKRMDLMEPQIHGSERNDAHFGVMTQPIRLVKGTSSKSQWTGVVTSIALSMLETKQVDAVVCIAAANDDDFGEGQPIIAKTPEQVLRGRGVKPSLAPSLKVLDEIQNDASIQKLLFCGVGCAVQAFRSIQHTLNVQEVYVLGTNCADNSPTPLAAKSFLQNGVGIESTQNVLGYEFMQDYKVHVKMKEGGYEKKPYFCLPGTIAKEAIAKSCLTCFDYTNGLADVVVGYMGAPLDGNNNMDSSYQTLTVRNGLGEKMVQTALEQQRIVMGPIAPGSGNYQSTSVATVSADSIILDMIDQDVPSSGMPLWIGNIMATLLSNIGPKGLNFAKYSIDYHILRNYLYILNEWGEERAQEKIPQYAMDIVNQYIEDNSTFRNLKETIIAKKAL